MKLFIAAQELGAGLIAQERTRASLTGGLPSQVAVARPPKPPPFLVQISRISPCATCGSEILRFMP